MAWTTVFDQLAALEAGTDVDILADGANPWSRLRFLSSLLSSAAGTSCRITVVWSSASGAAPNALGDSYFGQAGTDLGWPHVCDFTGDQVQVLWSGASTLNSSSGLSAVVSDPFTLAQTWDNTHDYLYSAWFNPSSGFPHTYEINTAGTPPTATIDQGQSVGVDVSGNTSEPSPFTSTANILQFIGKIEINVAGGPAAKTPFDPWPQLAPILAQ